MIIKKTITSIFMVPTLKVPKDQLRKNGFINGYVADIGKDPVYDNSVYLLFKPENLDKFRIFLDAEYERTKNIIEDYDYEGGFVVVVYQLDKNFLSDFNLVKQGKYSQTTSEFQKLFPKVIKIEKDGILQDETSLQFRIFNKTEDLVDFWEEKLGVSMEKMVGENFEVWEGFDEERESMNILKIKQEN